MRIFRGTRQEFDVEVQLYSNIFRQLDTEGVGPSYISLMLAPRAFWYDRRHLLAGGKFSAKLQKNGNLLWRFAGGFSSISIRYDRNERAGTVSGHAVVGMFRRSALPRKARADQPAAASPRA